MTDAKITTCVCTVDVMWIPLDCEIQLHSTKPSLRCKLTVYFSGFNFNCNSVFITVIHELILKGKGEEKVYMH